MPWWTVIYIFGHLFSRGGRIHCINPFLSFFFSFLLVCIIIFSYMHGLWACYWINEWICFCQLIKIIWSSNNCSVHCLRKYLEKVIQYLASMRLWIIYQQLWRSLDSRHTYIHSLDILSNFRTWYPFLFFIKHLHTVASNYYWISILHHDAIHMASRMHNRGMSIRWSNNPWHQSLNSLQRFLPIPLLSISSLSQHVASSSLQHICLKEVTRYNREKLLILFYGYVFVDLTGAKVTDVCGQAKGYIPCFRPQDKAYIITSFTYILTKTFH